MSERLFCPEGAAYDISADVLHPTKYSLAYIFTVRIP